MITELKPRNRIGLNISTEIKDKLDIVRADLKQMTGLNYSMNKVVEYLVIKYMEGKDG